ncbi:hypothetical protein, partial [Helicobacter sp. WB40]|uniref:hypothetical protein n=1 Tax=Helicobacter sp. WB40 TaxID=3004130 RepID=UPI0022EC098D
MGFFDLQGALSVAKSGEVIDYLRKENTNINWQDIDKATQEALKTNPNLDTNKYTLDLLSKNPISKIDTNALEKIRELENKATPQNTLQKGLDFINNLSTATSSILPTKMLSDPLLSLNEDYKKRKEAEARAIDIALKNNIQAKDLKESTQEAIRAKEGLGIGDIITSPFTNSQIEAQKILDKDRKLDSLLY